MVSPVWKLADDSILWNLKDVIGETCDLSHIMLFESLENLINGSPRQPLFVPRVDINASRSKKRLGKVRDNPLIIIIRMAETKTFPVRTRDLQPTLSSPIPSTRVARGWGINTMNRLDFLRILKLVLDQITDFDLARIIGGKQLVGNVDIALVFPQPEAGVGYMPCPDEEIIGWWDAFIALALGRMNFW